MPATLTRMRNASGSGYGRLSLDRWIALGIPICCVLLGYLTSRGYGASALAVVATILALDFLFRSGKAVLAGVVLVTTLSGIPLLNTQALHAHGTFQAIDVCVIAVIVIGAYGLLQSKSRISPFWRSTLAISSLGLTLVWIQSVIHGVNQGAPLLSAMLYGRDFLFFALLLPVAPYILSSRREVTRLVVTLAVLTTCFSLALIAASIHLVPSSLPNAYLAHTEGSILRIYTRMGDLIPLGFTCSLGYLLVGPRRYRKAAATILIVCTVAVMLLLTRALYLGLIVGILACAVTWAMGHSRFSVYMRKRMVLLVGVLCLGIALTVVESAVVGDSVLQGIFSRFGTGIENLQGQGGGGTVQLREHVASFELQLLGGQWLFGLGFLPPSVLFINALPNGSIRDVDLGLLQAVMTMGVVGTVFIYLPVVATTVKLARPLVKVTGQFEWLRLGIYVWLVSVLVGSLTLQTLFSETGLLLTAVVLGVAIRVSTLESVPPASMTPDAEEVQAQV
jgi:hypothetical protein